jgi:hypothetical protein
MWRDHQCTNLSSIACLVAYNYFSMFHVVPLHLKYFKMISYIKAVFDKIKLQTSYSWKTSDNWILIVYSWIINIIELKCLTN